MNEIVFTIDGVEVDGRAGQTILEVADAAGIYIPRLCHLPGLTPAGHCRVCTVFVNGRPQAACTQPAVDGAVVENSTEELRQYRRNLISMLFVEGNHYCMFCQVSGNCELQALAYRLGIEHPHYPYLFPKRDIDMTHPEVMIDRDRCILCSRCARASQELDGKHVFAFVHRSIHKQLAVNAETSLAGTDLAAADKAVDVCPVGSLVRKRQAYLIPVGCRAYDLAPIGTDIEAGARKGGVESEG